MVATPHGGQLTPRSVSKEQAQKLKETYPKAPVIEVTENTFADIEMFAVGAMAPLTGFVGKADYDSIIDNIRLTNGLVWPFPIVLAADQDTATAAQTVGAILLTFQGSEIALVEVEEVYEPDLERETTSVFGTNDASHPGVQYVQGLPEKRLAGPVHTFELPEQLYQDHRLTPAQTRSEFEKRGWETVVAFQTRNPIHRAHEYLTKVALEGVDGLIIHPLVGATKPGDIPADIRVQCYEIMMEKYYNPKRVLLAMFPAAMRYAGPREAIFHALTRKNYGCSHFIVGRDHAGVGDYYGTYDAQDIFNQFSFDDLGIHILKFEHSFYCTRTQQMATAKTTASSPEERIFLSGTKVREMLDNGQRPPEEFTRPEVADLLIQAYAKA
ncbi:sulfate adenylyltransferase-like [Ylistrum balloti]|uniref:sulfate adenylyltransferase-like n=1 Tax=Ylistrum balloti TaxID=509963 RepID=UPI0029059BBF|nr:sulfate adenylyltransferase-like [Ylistrum balloti]